MPLKSKQQPPYYQPGTNTPEYISLISQAGTAAPTNVVLLNTLGETPIFTRQATGEYIITTTNTTFPENKTSVNIIGINGGIAYYVWSDEHTLEIHVKDLTGTPSDDLLGNYTTLQIKKFN